MGIPRTNKVQNNLDVTTYMKNGSNFLSMRDAFIGSNVSESKHNKD